MRNTRLKFVACNVTGRAAADTSLPVVTLEDVESGLGRLVRGQVSESRPGEDGLLQFAAGDVLFGKLRPYLEKALLCTRSGFCSPELLVLRPTDVSSRFLFYLVRSADFISWANRTSEGVKMPRTSWEALGDFPVSLPSRDEQERIADSLDRDSLRVDELVAVKRRLRELLITKRMLIVEGGIGGYLEARKRTPSPIPWLPTVPGGWAVTRLQYSARLGSGHTPSRKRPDWWVDCTIPWITTGDVHKFRDDRLEVLEDTGQHISELGLANSSAELHPKGTVVLSRTASVGFSAIMGRAMATSQDFATWTCSEQLVPEFLLYCLRAMRRDLLGRLSQGSTHQTIYMPDIERIMVPLPPVDEQWTIVAEIRRRLAPIDSLVDALDGQLPNLFEYRRALITSAVAGDPAVAAA